MTEAGADAVLQQARGWADADCDADDRREILHLLQNATGGDREALLTLLDRFRGPLRFGTAGLRGPIVAGQTGMNRAVVRRTTFGLVRYVLDTVPEAAERGLVVGYDARRRSDVFARDVCGVAAAMGLRVHRLSGRTPTPLVAFAVPVLGAAAGVMVTASHNPPDDNGYKVFSFRGAQIVPPDDAGIAAEIDRAPPAREVPIIDPDSPGAPCETVDLADRYLEALDELVLAPDAPVDQLHIVYSPLHGVGAALFERAAGRRGFGRITLVREQAEPDGAFVTVRFPNPEEPGALDLALATADRARADLVLVNDPDADRLAVAVRSSDGTLRVLNGNQIGALLADHMLARDAPGDPRRLFVTTVVSSRLLSAMVSARGARYAETLTGFKWIADRGFQLETQEGLRFVFGYEEALGYTPKTAVRDKDGIRAAMVLAEYAAVLRGRGRTLLDALDDLALEHGLHHGRARSVYLPGRDGPARIRSAMQALRARGEEALAAVGGSSLTDHARPDAPFSPAELLVFELRDGGRVAVRPSGTEPKLKLYLEVVVAVSTRGELPAARARARARIAEIEKVVLKVAEVG